MGFYYAVEIKNKLEIILLYNDKFSISELSKQFKVTHFVSSNIEHHYRENKINSYKEK